MSLIKNIADIDKSQENLLFKIFEPRNSGVCFPELTNDGGCGSASFTGLSQGSGSPHSGQNLSPNVFNFDLTAYRGPAAQPSDLQESSSPNMFQLKFAGDPDLPKRLHVSNIPFRYR